MTPAEERRQAEARVRAAYPGQPFTQGIDRKGCYARIGDREARATDLATAMLALLPEEARG